MTYQYGGKWGYAHNSWGNYYGNWCAPAVTYKTYCFTGFTEADLLSGSDWDLGCGDSFTMPAAASVCFEVRDDDGKLSGDTCDRADDSRGQTATITMDGVNVGNNGQIYAEVYHRLRGSDGKTYYLIEIEQECGDAPGRGADYFTFYGAVPPAGVKLTIVQTCEVGSIDYFCLGAGSAASIEGRYFDDANGNGIDDGEAGLGGLTVQLLNATTGAVVATTVTAADGSYAFEGVAKGDYRVSFAAAPGRTFTADNVGGNDRIDSDAVAQANGTGLTGVIRIDDCCDTVKDVDAGAKVEPPRNTPPEADDDTGKTCADETETIAVLGNDDDADGDTLTITAVNGQAITAGNSVTVNGFTVTLNADGTLTYDGRAKHADLLVGDDARDSFTYTVSDGKGGTATATVTVDVCGADNTAASISARLPESVTATITLVGEDPTTGADVTIVDASGLLTGTYSGYCIDLNGDLNLDVPQTFAVFGPTDDLPAGYVQNEENLDLVNWILNQNLDAFSFDEVQLAIWNLTDGIETGDAEADQLAALARANGEGFVADEGDVLGIVLAPVDANGARVGQTFIVGVPFDLLALDCLC